MRKPRIAISKSGSASAQWKGVTKVSLAYRSSAFITASRRRGSNLPSPAQLAVKDNIAAHQLPTTCASHILGIGYQSPIEADVVTRHHHPGGFRVSGKTNLDEFGMGSHSMNSAYGPVRRDEIQKPRQEKNALTRDFSNCSAGGSSGGSAVAVAEGFVHRGLGTDTGGSVRLPSAYMGIIGFKPSYGIVSRWGVIPYANSLDTVGFMATSVDDVREALRLSAHHDARDPTSLSVKDRSRCQIETDSLEFAPLGRTSDRLKDLTIGFPVEYNIKELHPKVLSAWKDTLQYLQSNGAKVVPVSLPNTKHALSAYYVLAPAEAASNLSKYDGVRYGSRHLKGSDGSGNVLYSTLRGSGFGREVQNRIILGSYTLSSTAINNYFIKAQKIRRLVQRDFDRVFKNSNPLRPTEHFDINDLDESIPLQDKLGPAQVDFILCPTAPTPPPHTEEIKEQSSIDMYMNDVFTVPASLAGLPAISIPYGLRKPDSCIGIQLIGQYGSDFKLLEVAKQLDYILARNCHKKSMMTFRKYKTALRVRKYWTTYRAFNKYGSAVGDSSKYGSAMRVKKSLSTRVRVASQDFEQSLKDWQKIVGTK